MAFEYNKQPWEEEIIGVDFSRRISSGITILPTAPGVTDVTIEETVSLTSGAIAANYGGHLVISGTTLTGITGREKILAAMILAGVAGFKYRVSFRVTLSDSQKKEDDVWVIVKET